LLELGIGLELWLGADDGFLVAGRAVLGSGVGSTGFLVFPKVGVVVGSGEVGSAVGVREGFFVGLMVVELSVGASVGAAEGDGVVGSVVGVVDGAFEVGARVGRKVVGLTDGFSVGTGTASVELNVGVSVVTGFGMFVGSSDGDKVLLLGAGEGSAEGLEFFSAGESEFPAAVGAETGVESPSSCFSAVAVPATLVSPPSVLRLAFFETVSDCGSLTRLSSLSFFAHTRERTHSTINARSMRISV